MLTISNVHWSNAGGEKKQEQYKAPMARLCNKKKTPPNNAIVKNYAPCTNPQAFP